MAVTKQIDLKVISDSICPFCYLGYKKVLKGQELALQKVPDLKFSMRFEPFLLDPSLPADHGVNKRERYIAKFGSAETVAKMEERMHENGKPYGINFSYGGNIRQTTDSHRLLEKAYQQGGEAQQRKLLEGLFQGYFENEKDPGEPDFLATESEKAGLGSKDEILAFLKTDELTEEVKDGIHQAQMMGVSGVPLFVVNSKYAISGAQEPETFAEVFVKIANGEKVQ